MASTSDSGASDAKTFASYFDTLSAEILKELGRFEMPPDALEWIKSMLVYTVPGGKMNRGLCVVETLRALLPACNTSADSGERIEQAICLGWCVELLQAFFLIADDVMDDSLTRRGKPCWFRKVGNVAINDSFIIESCIYRVLRRRFGSHPCYAQILDLFHEVTLQTELGQLLDLTTAPSPGGPVDLEKYTMEKYRLIVKYKTAFYSFYLPVALALVLAGVTDQARFDQAKGVLLPLGEFFQIQDDYLDCYGDPSVIGKVGSDIEEAKCSWLIVTALTLADADQRKVLQECYGKKEAEQVSLVKQVFAKVGVSAVYAQLERDTEMAVLGRIEALGDAAVAAALKTLAMRIFGRKK